MPIFPSANEPTAGDDQLTVHGPDTVGGGLGMTSSHGIHVELCLGGQANPFVHAFINGNMGDDTRSLARRVTSCSAAAGVMTRSPISSAPTP
jgi:hypothetical protein